MERFDRKDRRFLLACLLTIAAGTLITAALFRRAFPEASIEFRVNRQQARAQAERLLVERGRNVSGHRFAARFAVDEEPKVYLERELGLTAAADFYGDEAKVWAWEMRWFRSGVKEEERVGITPRGDPVSFETVRREDAPGARLSREEALPVAARLLASRGLEPETLALIAATPVSRPARTDWTFVHEKAGFRMKDATVRYETRVSGSDPAAFREYVHVPEAWSRDYQKLRAKNVAANTVATLGFVVTALALLGFLVVKIARKDVPWKTVALFGVTGFFLTLLVIANGIPLELFDYDTSNSLSSHLTREIVLGILGALAAGASIAIIVAGAEPAYRERFPRFLSLSGMFSRRGFRTKAFFKAVLLGYALTAFFFAYQAVFYVVAAELGAWAPADIPYSDMLNTAFPWAAVLFVGFFPAVSEEGISRMFSIAFLEKIGVGRLLAIVLPAVIWGFGHAAYPNQPFYIRGVEVGLAGVLIGFLMVKQGVLSLLVWHFTVDALYTALLLLRSGNTYYVVSGAVAAGILLLPLAVSLALYMRRGGFASETGVTNGDEAFVPDPPPSPPVEEEAHPPRPVSRALLGVAAGAALLLATSFFFATYPREPLAQDATGRARSQALARRFLQANGVTPERFRMVAYLGTGLPDDEEVRSEKPQDGGRIPGFSEGAARYVLENGGAEGLSRLAKEKLPPAYWVVRFFEPGKKEEWKVLVDARRARVVAFLHPEEEAAPAGTAVSAERARERALSAASKLGYPAADYTVLDVGSEARPKRTDTTVVLEARREAIGQARPRLTAVFHGPRLSSFYPSLSVPEEFLRDFRRREVADWLLLAVKILAAGSLIGVGIVLFLRAVRRSEFRWRSLVPPLLFVGVLAAASLANGFPSVLRQYDTETPFPLFQLSAGVSLLIGWLGILLAAGIAFVLISSARPGWRPALTMGSLGDALLRASIAAAGLAGVSRWTAVAAARFPLIYDPDPTLPSALERLLPSYAVLWSALFATISLAALTSVIFLAASGSFFRRPVGLALASLALLFVLAPTRFGSGGDFAAAFVPDVLVATWIAFSVFGLLRDDVRAWVLFGALAFGGRAAAGLLDQPAFPDRTMGGTALVLLAVLAAFLLFRRRRAGRPVALTGVLLGTLLCASVAAGAPRPARNDAIRAWRAAHETEILRELADLLAIPNVASDSVNIRRNAEHIRAMLARRGVRAELLEHDGAPPVVFGELAAPGAKRTVLLYAHYDGQPVNPSKWAGDPWKPILRDAPLEAGGREIAWPAPGAPFGPEWRLYARSASDDKAPIVGLLAALDALRAAKVPLSVNLKFFLEGEEEAGSPHLAGLLAKHRDRLRADVWLLFDGPVHQTRKMQVFFGARGVQDLEITAYGPVRRLHSGHYGNWAPNPAVELAHLVAGMRDREGRITIAGFSDDVRPATEAEKAAVAASPPVEEALRAELGLGRNEGGETRLADAILLPALNVRGISAGDVGAAATNSIPTEARLSIDFRLVPDQTPEKLKGRVEEHLRKQGYFVTREAPNLETRRRHPRILLVEWGPGYPAARTPLDLPVSRAVVRTIEEAAGEKIVVLPTLGGSVPMHLFAELGAPVVGVPIANHDNNQHAANENLRIQNLWDGIEYYAALMARLGQLWK